MIDSVYDQTINLIWQAPGDDSLTGRAYAYDVRYDLDSLTDQTWGLAHALGYTGSPGIAGTLEKIQVTDSTWQNNQLICLGVKTRDEGGNWSGLSNVVSEIGLGRDSIPPSQVVDLFAEKTDASSIKLYWTAPGDDSTTGTAHSYDIRYADSLMTEGNFSFAAQIGISAVPLPSGESQELVVSDLLPEAEYWFALKAVDNNENWSGLSNVTSTSLVDTIPPAAITDLLVTKTSPSSISLSWTAPGNDSTKGRASSYDIRYANSAIDESNWLTCALVATPPTPSPGGQVEHLTVDDLQISTEYYFAIKTSDPSGNSSGLSNVVSTSTTSGVQVLWAKTLPSVFNEEVVAIARVADGYILAGSVWSSDSSERDGLVVKIDSAGTKVWTSTIDNGADDRLADIAVFSDGGFVVAGKSQNAARGDYDALLVSFNQWGDSIWIRSYGLDSSDDLAKQVVALPGDAIAFVGSIYKWANVTFVNSDGFRTREKLFASYGNCSADEWAKGTAAVALSDGSVLTAWHWWGWQYGGHTGGCGPPMGGLEYWSVDESGSSIKIAESPGEGSSCKRMITFGNGSVAALAHIHVVDVVQFYSENGTSEWELPAGDYADLILSSQGNLILLTTDQLMAIDQQGNTLGIENLVYESPGLLAKIESATFSPEGEIMAIGWVNTAESGKNILVLKISTVY